MAAVVPALPRSSEVFPESRSWTLCGHRARRRLVRRPETRRPCEPGSNVKLSRKCSCTFRDRQGASETSSPVRTRPPRVRPRRWADLHRHVGDVWLHKARRWTDAGVWASRPASGHVRPHVGTSAQQPARRWVAIRRERSKKGLAIPPVGVTMCDRLKSALVIRGHEAGRRDGKTWARRGHGL
jgi:hypothetical protein